MATKRFLASFKIFGVDDLEIDARIKQLKLATGLTISYRITFPEVEVLIQADDSALLEQASNKIRSAFDNKMIVSETTGASLPEVLHQLLLKKKLTLALAESCTGGLTSKLLTDFPGSSEYFLGGAVVYSNQLKSKFFDVPEILLKEHGAVSHQTAKALAEGCRKKTGADLSLSITGIAGPTGGSREKPVGTFYVGFSEKRGTESYHFCFPSTRERVRRFASFTVLAILRRFLLELP